MIWLLAEDDEEAAGAGYALTGWHAAAPRDRRGARRARAARTGIMMNCAPSSSAGSRNRASPSSKARGRGGQQRIASAAARGLRGGRTQLADGARPDRDRGAGGGAAARDRDRHLGGAPRALTGSEVAREAAPDIPGEEEPTSARSSSGSIATCAAAATGRRRSSSRSRTARCSATPSSRLGGDGRAGVSRLTGVKRVHRGRGIAVLKAAQIAWAKEHGFSTLQTSNEVRNAPIRHLNAKHGYVLEPGVVIVRRSSPLPEHRLLERPPADDAGEVRAELGACARVRRRLGSLRDVPAGSASPAIRPAPPPRPAAGSHPCS